MASAGLLALLDDITLVLDDVAVMTKVATKKTAGVLGDDLALNAEQVSGVRAERELPVVWAVAKGSFVNKLILVPAALAISAIAPWAILPLLMMGGIYLCFEGFEKCLHKVLHSNNDIAQAHNKQLAAVADSSVNLIEFERDKIRGAIRTDFILSAEIIVIALGTVKDASFALQASVVSTVALLVTVGVYSLVAGIVKLDDAGIYLIENSDNSTLKNRFGKLILALAPKLMKTLSVIGTAAMFMVGGGIIAHGIPWLHHLQETLSQYLTQHSALLSWLGETLFTAFIGVATGALALAIVFPVSAWLASIKKNT